MLIVVDIRSGRIVGQLLELDEREGVVAMLTRDGYSEVLASTVRLEKVR